MKLVQSKLQPKMNKHVVNVIASSIYHKNVNIEIKLYATFWKFKVKKGEAFVFGGCYFASYMNYVENIEIGQIGIQCVM